jgi:hypothetical protein
MYDKPLYLYEMSRTRLLSTPRSFLFSAGGCRPVSGIRLRFKPVSGNGSENECLADADFFMDIIDIHERRIMLTFHNQAAVPCAISNIYFEDGDTFSISVQSVRGTGPVMTQACAIDTGTGSQQSAPVPCDEFCTCRAANRNPEDADAMQDGIKPNESLGIVFDLQTGVTLADIVNALSKGMLNISLKLPGMAQDSGGILVNDTRLGLSPG